MKKIFKICLLLLLSLTAMKSEEVVFDLLAQDFEVRKDTCSDARYIVSKDVTIDTNMFAEKGFYVNCNGQVGYLNIVLDKQISNFIFDTNFIIENSVRTKEGNIKTTDNNPHDRSIRFTDEMGKMLVITFKVDEMIINEKTYKVKLDFQDKVAMSVSNINGDLSVIIDGQKIYTNKHILSKIKYIDLEFYNSAASYDSYPRPADRLRTLRLISHD